MVYFNSWAISSLICSIFTFVVFAFLAGLRKKANYTSAFLLLFFLVFLVNFGFFLSAIFPYPFASYHRMLTGFGALFGSVFLCIFAYLYPKNENPKETKYVIGTLISISVLTIIYSFYQILTNRPKFDFTGQIYTYPQKVGSILAIFLLVFTFIMIVIQVRKLIRAEKEDRKPLFQISLGMIVTYLVPIVSNLLLREGVITFNIFQQLYVGFMILGYFTLIILFINNTVDKTSFMTKIVGITVATCLVFAQGFSTVVNLKNESFFDEISLKEALTYLNTGRTEGSSIAYIVSLSDSASKPKLLVKNQGVEPNLSVSQKDILENTKSENFSKRISTINFPKNAREDYVPSAKDLFYSYYIRDEVGQRTLQVAFPYLYYRKFLDDTNRWIVLLIVSLVFVILVLFPVFFNRSLVRPLNTLISGVGEVNLGNLSVRIPVLVQDEIGYLSDSFNKMVGSILEGKTQLEEYADTLEEKVEARTREVTEKMEEIHALKVQQDGDYFLTSLLSKPLMTNWNRSAQITTNFYIEQKKKFIFKNKESEIGGDICISGNLLFGPEKEKWTMFLNGDAMGKSMQGAGGAIVLGTAMNNIMARSASKGKVLNVSPEEWIQEAYRELDDIFRTFDGVMMASAILGVLNDRTGKMYYFNAEHPWAVLLRDGKASFLESELTLRKLGSPTEMSFKILEFQLSPGDVLYIGSDGRDDINLTEDGVSWVMNSDENLFLKTVEDSKGDLDTLVAKIHGLGALSDDLSLIRIGFQEQLAPNLEETKAEISESALRKYAEAKALLQQKEIGTAIVLLEETIEASPNFKPASRLLGQVYYDRKEYAFASRWFEKYLEEDPDSPNIWFLLSVCYKHMKEYDKAGVAAEKVRISQPHRLANLINLSDNYRLLGRFSQARSVLDSAQSIDGENPGVRKLDELLKSKGH
ncbi:HAMP domain-containing protein [Leptospira langatensis]|uniref:HAMP domain-containing protein n=1 Tax=Leptospira langatensis TaxID=2484983 RepID=A0A5F1ZWL7_9LEPT|nr:SpoIIE family protein phosphatase [Leptospira langatensis]TGK01563.1 HAMP domain-containing protein [Leptospira langatensis]TGL41987.1 HAMP domain-containing protein [Leptospira langatensis]